MLKMIKMRNSSIRLKCSKRQFNKMLHDAVADYDFSGRSFWLKERKDCIILKPQVMLQRKAHLIHCIFKPVELNDHEILVKITFLPAVTVNSLIFNAMIVFFLYNTGIHIVKKFDFKILFFIILGITIPTFFYWQEIIACDRFLEYFLGKWMPLKLAEVSNGRKKQP